MAEMIGLLTGGRRRAVRSRFRQLVQAVNRRDIEGLP
jgi:hypothetical protein